jgi:uncharacterized flavoprotein (TIGR03862 family)
VSHRIAIIGGGPAGLAAAEVLARTPDAAVTVYDAMPSVGRKFLMAGRGGLNLTHSEPLPRFLGRYGARAAVLSPMVEAFGPAALRAWADGLGVATFVGTSGRVFPTEMKAAPLLRTWIRNLKAAGVTFRTRHRWRGWSGAALMFETPAGDVAVEADATILALGGGSWPSLGSDGAWVPVLQDAGVDVASLRPANCGFDVGWSGHFRERFAGTPVKAIAASVDDGPRQRGECMITDGGIEGGLVYALSAPLRDRIETEGTAVLTVDLAPGLTAAEVTTAITRPHGKASLSTHLRKAAGIDGVKAGLLREMLTAEEFATPARLAAAIKALPLRVKAPRPIAEVISTAGGVRFEALDENLMLRAKPGVFCAGEMLDWEAPTGGYLLTACFASGRAAGSGVVRWLMSH